MSLEKNCEEVSDQTTSKPNNKEDSIGSHFALHVALRTLKERCQHLQMRLSSVEQENLRLWIENRKIRSDSACKSEEPQSNANELQRKIANLEEQVNGLQKTKSDLKHHLCMVVKENEKLWSRLSHLMQTNQNLGSHLSKISNTLIRHHSTSSIVLSKSQSPTNSFSQDSSDADPNSPFSKNPEGSEDESIQEMFPKLIKNLRLNKTELEDQCAQMTQIQSDLYSINLDCLEEVDRDEADTVEDLKQYHKNLVQLRDQMSEQQSAMKTVLGSLQHAVKEGQLCNSCKERAKNTKATTTDVEMEAEMESLRQWGTSDEKTFCQRQVDVEMSDKICPMCGKLYDKDTPFSSFQQHVTDHFTDDEDESYSIINNFDVPT